MGIAHRYHRPAAVLMIDLGHFKHVSDTFGHHAGDEALKSFSQICKEAKRHTDIVGRTGGEEFAIFLPETELEDAVQLAERICERTRNNKLEVDGDVITYTVSVGVAVLADKALYEAKDSGRDQLCIYSE